MENQEKYFAGIDPGQTGGIGILDAAGDLVGAHRWDKREPVSLYNILLLIKSEVEVVYLEMVNAHPGEGVGHVTRNLSLIANWGIWQGWLMAAGLPYLLIHPATWQSRQGLHNWQAKLKDNPEQLTPLSMARARWPSCNLDHQADDGKAAALLLADTARLDYLEGIDRRALQLAAEIQKKARKRKARITKAQKDLFKW